jgi:hypothetical protein
MRAGQKSGGVKMEWAKNLGNQKSETKKSEGGGDGVNAWQFYLLIAILNPPAGPSSSLSKSLQTEPQDRSIAVEFIAEFRALLPLLLPD